MDVNFAPNVNTKVGTQARIVNVSAERELASMLVDAGCVTTDAISYATHSVTFVLWHGVISAYHMDTVTDVIVDVIRCHQQTYFKGHSQAALDSPATGIRTSGQASSLSPPR